MAVYENKKGVDEKTLAISSKNTVENLKWFSEQYPSKKIKSVQLVPYPKEGAPIDPKHYYLKVGYSK